MLSYSSRFHGHSSLRFVFKNGETVRSRLLTVRYVRNSHRRTSRYSVSISKKIFKSAVKRNRIRRRIYEIIRTAPAPPDVHDIVIIVTSPDLLTMEHTALTESIGRCFAEAGLSPTPES